MAISIKLDTAKLDQIAAGLNVNRVKVCKKLAFDVEASAKTKAPVLTGALRNSIYTETIDGGNYVGAASSAKSANSKVNTDQLPKPTGNVVANVGPCVEYGIYVEMGTSRKGARPFLTPAAEEVARKLNDGSTWKELFE